MISMCVCVLYMHVYKNLDMLMGAQGNKISYISILNIPNTGAL